MTWFYFALLTVLMWGIYGVLLHEGQSRMCGGMASAEAARYKSFLLVGIAYFVVAVMGPVILLTIKGLGFGMSREGITWSFIAGVAGAIGALGTLLASSNGGTPPVVMSIVFAGAPIINSFFALYMHPPEGGWASIPWKFWLGLVIAISGAAMVLINKPPPAKAKAASHATR